MGDQKRAQNPLLYIHQPNIQAPRASMQSHYMTPKKARDNQQKAYPKRKTRPATRTYDQQQEDDRQTADDVEYPEDNQDHEEGDKEDDDKEERKKFKDMTLEERIDYFLNAPKYAPAMRCEVKTNGRSYRGAIIDYQENTVYMRIRNRVKPAEVPFETINDIRLLGF